VRQPHHVLDLGEHRVGVEVPGDDVLLVQLLEGLIIHLNGVNENAALGEEGAQVAPLRGGHCCKKSNWNPSSQTQLFSVQCGNFESRRSKGKFRFLYREEWRSPEVGRRSCRFLAAGRPLVRLERRVLGFLFLSSLLLPLFFSEPLFFH
jgi:hypothetical protein